MKTATRQRIYSGSGCVKHLKTFLADSGCRKILLVAGRSFQNLPVKNDIEDAMPEYVLFHDFKANPSYEEVCNGVKKFRQESCDAIVAVGGGSALDVAKCIKLFCRMPDTISYLEQEYSDTGIPLAAIPTTAGTGSESTRYAVIYLHQEKQSVTHESIVPDCAFLDPAVLHTLPLYQKKCTLLDALCQGIESWWSVNSTEESKPLSGEAVRLIMQNYRAYLSGDQNAAAEIMTASNKAGQAINITQTTAAHAMSYKLTSMYNLPHGRAVAVCLPFLWEYMKSHPEKCVDQRGGEYVQKTLGEIAEVFSPAGAVRAADKFKELLKELEIDCVVPEQAGDLEKLVASVNPIRLKNNPVSLSEEVLRDLYRKILSCRF